ncbi:DUF771 domain-containing protein [Lactiplantibacillus plantarum]|nr:DUF771 domain-containing protein [Lactiplantibacillus plantarum]
MSQSLLDQIEVTGTFRFPLPDGMKLVPVDSHGYEGESLTGRWWTMKDLREWCANKSVDWLKDNILENPRYSREIEQWNAKAKSFIKVVAAHEV